MSINTLGPIQGQVRGTTDNEALSVDTVLVAADLGKLFTLDAVGEAITIPAATGLPNGATYEFLVLTTVTTSNWTITSAATDMIGCIQVSDDADLGPAADTAVSVVQFVDSSNICVPGNYVKVQVLGEFWHVTGICSVAEAILL